MAAGPSYFPLIESNCQTKKPERLIINKLHHLPKKADY